MRRFVRKQLTIFLVGFVVAFIIYLFVRFNVDQVVLGVVIGAGAGLALNVTLYLLERRFPEQIPGGDAEPR
jgi:hypothetical protein